MKVSFLKKWQFIIVLGLLGCLSIFPLRVSSEPLCYIVTEGGQTVDLGKLCQPKYPQKNSPANSATSQKALALAAVEEPEKFDYKPTNKPFMQEVATTAEIVEIEEGLKVPDILRGAVSQEQFERRPRCQDFAKLYAENPSLFEPRTETRTYIGYRDVEGGFKIYNVVSTSKAYAPVAVRCIHGLW